MQWLRSLRHVFKATAAPEKLAKAAETMPFGQLGRVVKSANLLGFFIDSHIMANTANAANAFTTGRG